MILNAVGSVLSIFLMIGIGIFIYIRRWITRQEAGVFAKIVINIAVPANVLKSFLTDFNKDIITSSYPLLLAGYAAMAGGFLLAWLISPLIGINKNRRGVFSVLFAFSNSVFIGFPVAAALFGDTGMPFAVMFYLVNTTMFWTLGYFGVRHDAKQMGGIEASGDAKDIWKGILNVPLLFIGIGIGLMYLNVSFPPFIDRVLGYMAGLTTPLSLIFTGIVLADIGIKQMRFEWDILKVMIGRVIIAPAAMLLAVILIGIQGLGAQVFVVQSSLPVMLQTVILSEHFRADAAFASKSFAWTTVAALVTIPAYMVLVNEIF